MDAGQILGWCGPILAALATCAGQLWLNQRFKRADEKRDAAQAQTDAKRKAEAEWRDHIIERLDTQDDRIDTILTAQCSAVCKANGIVNNFVDMMVERVMQLPERSI